jgi:TatD DNase family protein
MGLQLFSPPSTRSLESTRAFKNFKGLNPTEIDKNYESSTEGARAGLPLRSSSDLHSHASHVMLPLFDAHNHLHDAWLSPYRERVIADLISNGIEACVVNGSNENDWPEVSAFCSSNPQRERSTTAGSERLRLLPSFGLHPWDVGNRTADWQRNLLHHLDHEPSVAIGEIGLDRWMLDRARPDDPRLAGLRRASLDEQIGVFRWQLTVAAERNLPASIHCLDAFGALHDVLRSTPLPARGFLLHAYNGSIELSEAFTKLGAYFSFNGAFLEPRKSRLRDLYINLPADRLLVETDAPAMGVPLERERFTLPNTSDGEPINHPANLIVTYAALAELRGTDVDLLTAQVADNFQRLFGSPDPSRH